jgi:methionine transaminase
MTALAKDYRAVNLSQGFPDFPVSPELIDLVNFYMKEGYNQYAPMTGIPELRKGISKMFKQNHGIIYDPDSEINITAGATQALYTAISAFIGAGDEVIIFEPAYDSYAPAVIINGGVVRYSELHFPDYRIKWDELKKLVNDRTKMIIINTPHNPTGNILHKEDMVALEHMIRSTDIVVLSDEVYEHLIFDGHKHQSACHFQDLALRTILVGSFGKTFHATGWKIGFVLAPENLMKEFRKVHQFTVFAVNTPIQMAIAEYLKKPKNYSGLNTFFQQKRDFFVNALKPSRFEVIPSFGTYFQLLGYHTISDESEMDFAEELVKVHGLASVPVSAFYHDQTDNKMLRFCFAKEESTLMKAAEILCGI